MTLRSPLDDSDSREPDSDSEHSVSLALDRARSHSQLALSEAVATARALIDAASIGLTGQPTHLNPFLSDLAAALDRYSAGLATAATSPSLQAVLDALDAQIQRWEQRSHNDPDARGVLRAFLGLREILWESGFRPGGDDESPTHGAESPTHPHPQDDDSTPDPIRHVEFSS
jgi:hypothetical protein